MIDTHSHINFEDYKENFDRDITNASEYFKIDKEEYKQMVFSMSNVADELVFERETGVKMLMTHPGEAYSFQNNCWILSDMIKNGEFPKDIKYVISLDIFVVLSFPRKVLNYRRILEKS